MSAPLAVDLYCGLGGWSEGLIAAGWYVVGFDLEDMRATLGEAPLDDHALVIQDILTLHGRQFKDAQLIVGSSPCQEFSYRAMPWKRAKALGPPELGMRLFEAQFRIQREACEAAGRYIPLVVENVRGAQPWVGRAKTHFGSYYLWGDVPALMPIAFKVRKNDGETVVPAGDAARAAWRGNAFPHEIGRKLPGFRFDGSGGSFQSAAVSDSFGWSKQSDLRCNSSGSSARKAASARIAKIPFELAHWIGRAMFPPRQSKGEG